MADANLGFSRVSVDLVNRNKVQAVYDFAYADYISLQTFFDDLSNIITSLANGETFTTKTGVVIDPESPGGLLALQTEMDTIQLTKDTWSGLSQLGKKTENKLWTLQS